MQSDSWFTIGNTHKVCQDYIAHGKARVILSDGCSAAPHSDTGSRILTHCALHEKCSTWKDVINRADDIVQLLGLPTDCLCATLMDMRSISNKVCVNIIGDGSILAGKENGDVHIYNISFQSGAPFYLRYLLDDSKEKYLEEFGDLILETYDWSSTAEVSNLFKKYPEGIIYKEFDMSEYKWIGVFSDGLHSFQKIENGLSQTIDVRDIINEVTNFKNFIGSFVQRRCNRAFKLFKDKGWINLDDFSMGVIKI